MAYHDLRDFIDRLQDLGELHRVPVPVDPDLEAAAVIDRVCKFPGGGPALLFEKILGIAFPVAANLFGSERRMAEALGVARLDDLSGEMLRILAALPGRSSIEKLSALSGSEPWHKATPLMVADAPCQEVIEASLDLTCYPFLKSWPRDGSPDHGGRFITLPLVVTGDPASGMLNCGMYRVAILGPDRLGIRWSAESGAAGHAEAWRLQREPMPVAIAVGGDPATLFAATLPLPPFLDEFTFAGLLRESPVELVCCRTSNLPVPAGAELVIEGYIDPGAVARDGAFGNHTGSYVVATEVPLMRVTAITRRSDMIYPATVVGPPPMEDCWLARGAERLLLPLIRIDQPAVVDLFQPFEGIFHRATIVAISKSGPGEGRKMLDRLWQTPWLKRSRLLVVVDAEQAPADVSGVFWRVMNNVNWQRDLVVDGERLGLDATRKFGTELSGENESVPVHMSDEITAVVERRWKEYGFDRE